jgi:23S rRNA (guanosine2251-2'-O)-methyltransferase
MKSLTENRKNRRPWKPHREAAAPGLWLYGHHAVAAALGNPRRKLKRLVLTKRAGEALDTKLLARVRAEFVDADAVSRLLPPGAVHQGIALECAPLGQHEIGILARAPDGRRNIVVVLDQISDPHNVGAILRSAAAFGVAAVIVQDRHAPPESGVLAKAASGALDLVPYITVVNIARTLKELGDQGYWRVALAGDGEQPLKDAVATGNIVLVLGSEGSGLRRLVRETCDAAAVVPITSAIESLNVSNAAAVALYECRRG